LFNIFSILKYNQSDVDVSVKNAYFFCTVILDGNLSKMGQIFLKQSNAYLLSTLM